MLSTFIEGLQDGLNDEHRTAFRTMFVTKRDVETAIALAEFYTKAKELAGSYEFLAEYMDAKLAISDVHTDMLVAELKDIEQRLPK